MSQSTVAKYMVTTWASVAELEDLPSQSCADIAAIDLLVMRTIGFNYQQPSYSYYSPGYPTDDLCLQRGSSYR